MSQQGIWRCKVTESSDQARRRQIRERLATATKGPWHWTDPGDGRFMIGTAGGDGQMYHADAIAYVLRSTARGEVLLADLDLIAHAPDDLAWYEGQLTQAEQDLEISEQTRRAHHQVMDSQQREIVALRARATAAEAEVERLRSVLTARDAIIADWESRAGHAETDRQHEQRRAEEAETEAARLREALKTIQDNAWVPAGPYFSAHCAYCHTASLVHWPNCPFEIARAALAAKEEKR
jgi:hypothetical protein